MTVNIGYKIIEADQISPQLFSSFNRYQQVSKCWRKEDGSWILRDIPFIEDWNADDIDHLVNCLKEITASSGYVVGAFSDDRLIGFASVEGVLFGNKREYIQLSNLHISCDYRGCGIGKALFMLSADYAREMGAKKLYISSHSAEETRAFYMAMGCVEAAEYNQKLAEAEPCDCQLEYQL